ncbi:MAG: hypothetical protein H6720_04845 [Sandaracinus sp.]|nr:hypothetical protein [Sandaracinus sp.]
MKRSMILVGVLLLGCGQGASESGGGNVWAQGPSTAAEDEGPPETASGATCAGNQGCPRGQVCVAESCRHRRTSVRAEALASAADAQRTAGDSEGALASYEEALSAYASAEAPVPADVACAAALVALRYYDSPEERERGARFADRCFRASLPGHPQRVEVLRAVGRLRYDGLALGAFDEATAPERFFTQEPSRPTVDAIELALSMPDATEPGYDTVRETLRSEDATRIVADCFIQDWELRHQRQARASLILKLETRLRDMGDYDVYEGAFTVEKTALDVDGFEPCLAAGLTAYLAESGARVGRSARWQVPFEVAAQL